MPDLCARTTAAVLVAAVTVSLCRLRRRLFVVVVHGASMLPTCRDGDRLVAIRGAGIRIGDLVVFDPPPAAHARVDPGRRGRLMVKRVSEILGDPARVVVRGDAPHSLDSTLFGPIALSAVRGRVVRGRLNGHRSR